MCNAWKLQCKMSELPVELLVTLISSIDGQIHSLPDTNLQYYRNYSNKLNASLHIIHFSVKNLHILAKDTLMFV